MTGGRSRRGSPKAGTTVYIYRDYDIELSEFPDDQRVIASHYAKIKDT